MTALETRNLVKQFGGFRATSDVSLKIADGAIRNRTGEEEG